MGLSFMVRLVPVFFILVLATRAGAKSATAAAMIRQSHLPKCSLTTSNISAALSTRTSLAASGGRRAVGAVISVTLWPALRAARASA